MGEKFLDRVYGQFSTEETRDLYDAWAKSYEAEVGENGYVTPERTARALFSKIRNSTASVLDFGCGTGLSGLALKLAGFTTIDGADLSPEMMALAREKSIYRKLWQVDPEAKQPVPPGVYDAITAIGVIGVGAAPLSTFDLLMNALGPGGYFAFSFNDHALADPSFEAKVNEWVDCGAAHLLVRDYDEHLPGAGLKSMVYVIRKA